MIVAEDTEIKVILFGGPLDGAAAFVPFVKPSVKIGVTQYTDSYFVDDNGNAIFYCSHGAGKLKRSYVNKLFKDKNCLG